jgi:hypothetical protein
MKKQLSGRENRGFCQLRQTLNRSICYAYTLFVYTFDVPSDVFIFVITVCENIQEISQKWLHTRVQAIVPCIPGESKYTRRDMTVLAETCQKLAKFPSIRDYGPEFVKTQERLHSCFQVIVPCIPGEHVYA